jgi:hypothetical protein
MSKSLLITLITAAMLFAGVAAVSIGSAQAPSGATQTEPPFTKPPKGRKPRPGDLYPQGLPRYQVEAVSFRAHNETHWPDRLGSDEIYARFYDVGRGTLVTTNTKTEVDAGETHTFDPQQSCIAPIDRASRGEHGWSCAAGGAAAPLEFDVALFENDDLLPGGYCQGNAAPGDSRDRVRWGDCGIDALIGSATIVLSPSELATELPHPGRTLTRRIVLIQCPSLCADSTKAKYSLTYRVTRLADHVADTPIVGAPR